MAKTAHRLVALPPKSLPPRRDWQDKAIEVANDILFNENKPHIYVCAPTASGKTRFIHDMCEELPIEGERVIIVGLEQISEQLRNGFYEEYGFYVERANEAAWYISPKGNRVYIGTYQGLTALANKLNETGRAPDWRTAVIFFDEIHVGGSNSSGRTGDEEHFFEKSSVQRIFDVFSPVKRVYVSATMQTADETILGEKRGHFHRYSLTSAYNDNILNPVDMVEVHTGTTLKIKKIEDTFGKNIERLETLSDDDLEDLAQIVKDRAISLTEIQTVEDASSGLVRLVEARHCEMINLYAEKHFGEQAIFYCPNIKAAIFGAKYFNSMVNSGRFKGKKPNAFAYHSEADKPDEKLKNFLNGNTKVLFVVGMLQEGFDMPALALAFDCHFHREWNPAKIARLIQKIGRLMRKDVGKARSRYYYARDVSDYIATVPRTPNINDENPDEAMDIESVIESDDPDLEEAGLVAAKIIASADGAFDFDTAAAWEGSDITVGLPTSETINIFGSDDEDHDDHLDVTTISRKPIKLITTPLFVAIDAFGHAVKQSFDFCSIIGGNSADHNKKALLALPVGEERPHWKETLGKVISDYTAPRNNTYDAEFDAKIRARQPKWFREMTVAEKKGALLALPVSPIRPHAKKDILGKALPSYTGIGQCAYDAEFDAKIRARQPAWFPDKMEPAEKKAALLALPVSPIRPHAETDLLGRALKCYIASGEKTYDAEFTTKIRARQPKWFPDKMAPAEKKATLLALPVSPVRPNNMKDPLGRALKSYINTRGSSYDADFDAKIRARQPKWFKK